MNTIQIEDRFHIITQDNHTRNDDFTKDVIAGLNASPKTLSCRFLYDPEGSKIFEEICRIPEYYVTRTERSILEKHAEEIALLFPQNTLLAELGSGSAEKTRLLIASLLIPRQELLYVPIDISSTAL